MNGAAGFLERLAQRAQGQESGIRPLLPPLFAPEKPTAGSPALEERVEAPTTLAQTSPPPLRTKAAAPPAGQPLPPPSPTGVHPLVEQSIPKPPLSMMPPELHHSLDLVEPSPAPTPPPPRPPASRIPAAEAPLLPEQQTLLRTEAIPTPPLPPPVDAGAPAESEPLLLPLQPAPAIFNQPVVTNEGSPGASQEREEPPTQPAVHVSIGRIEVRAVRLAQPPVAPRAEPHPSMTLDEYLRRLNEGAK